MYSGERLYRTATDEFKKVKIGTKTLDDATLNLGNYAKIEMRNDGHRCLTKGAVYKALADRDLNELRHISNFFYDINGVYQRVCNYVAYLYRYDWYIASATPDLSNKKEDKVLQEFYKLLNYFDNSYVKKMCGEIALQVVKNGCYYGYIVPSNDRVILQDLPSKFCRTRYSVDNMPVVEFDMRFFDLFRDITYRMKVLKMFPDEFSKGYVLYKQGKLVGNDQVDDFGRMNSGSWYILEPGSCVKFNLNGSDIPIFINSIPAIMDLDAAQELDRKKQMQKLLKIIVQKLPLDKNGDLIFDVDEARDIHNNAVKMLGNTIGVDVLTTFTDVDSIDMSDKNTTTTTDDLSKVERSVYNSLGISQNLFNTDGNLSLEKSILNDESTIRNLLLQFSVFFGRMLRMKVNKKYDFQFCMLETTQYNYQALAKLYKEQTQMGFSKMLPQVALGHSQSFILNTAHFENEVLHLSEIMIPPLMSSTMGSEDIQALGSKGSSNQNKTDNNSGGSNKQAAIPSDKEAGRPEKPDDQKSTKTIQNKESMS